MPVSPSSPTPRSPATPLTAPQKALRKLGLVRDIDLALHLPLRYEDETRIVCLRDAREGDEVQIEAVVTANEVNFRPRRQLLVTVDDGSDTCTLRFFNFYPSQQKALAVGTRVRARGEVRGGFSGRTMMHPVVRAAAGALPDALTPVYPTVAGLPQAYLRRAVATALERADLSETLPAAISDRNAGVPAWDLRRSLTFLHRPTPEVSIAELEARSHPAWQRLKAEELLAQQLSQLQAKRERDRLRAPSLCAHPGGLHERLLAALPFGLTGAQRSVGEEIACDLARAVPMHRLLQGDVGSGKTVVAALAAAIAIDAGWQCALMAPTEILAEQHFNKLIGWLEPLGIQVARLSGSQKKKERREMLERIESGAAALVVGTHAVIQEQVKFRHLALAIIDEQHRFGVAQRLALRGKMGVDAAARALDEAMHGSSERADMPAPAMEPHLLMMSATPIPRTLAMSYYADLDVSTLDELPPGRTPVVTKVVSDRRRDEVIERIRAQLAQERQVYWVCPLIEESEALDLSNATATHAELSRLARRDGRPAAFAHGAGRKKGGDGPVQGGAGRRAGVHHGDRGRGGRAQCLADGDRACRALRPVAAAPAARAGRSRRGGVGLRADVQPAGGRTAQRGVARAPARHGRDARRLRHRPSRPGNPRARRVPRSAAVGRCAAALCRPGHRCGPAGVGAGAGATAARPAPGAGAAPRRALVGGKIGVSESLIAMTLTELKYIVAVAREKHFGKAAEACFVSQPTLSVAIRKLEDELEVKLFERSASEVSVTPLGEEIVRQAQSVLEQAAAIKDIAKRGKDPLAGPLKLGVIYTIGPTCCRTWCAMRSACRRRCR
jgi:ATP-dependent DNA helicase RecG